MRSSSVTETAREGSRFKQPLSRRDPYLMTRWKYLWREEFVEMRREGRKVDSGCVDDVSPDGTIIWIHLTTGRGRVMIHVDDGLDIWRVDTRILQDRGAPNPAHLATYAGRAATAGRRPGFNFG